MTTLQNGNLYQCDICGEKFTWNENCARWSSYALDEACPQDIPCACENPDCHIALKKNIKSGKFVLPTTKMRYAHSEIVTERRGY